MYEIVNSNVQITHETNEEGYRITVFEVESGALIFSWLMSKEDAARFAQQMINTLGPG